MIEFFRGLIKLMWDSSGYYEVDVEFFRGMPIVKNFDFSSIIYINYCNLCTRVVVEYMLQNVVE